MIKFERSDGRYYYMSVERDLFNDLVLMVIRGGASANRRYSVCVGHVQDIMAELLRLCKRRLQRGYILVQ